MMVSSSMVGARAQSGADGGLLISWPASDDVSEVRVGFDAERLWPSPLIYPYRHFGWTSALTPLPGPTVALELFVDCYALGELHLAGRIEDGALGPERSDEPADEQVILRVQADRLLDFHDQAVADPVRDLVAPPAQVAASLAGLLYAAGAVASWVAPLRGAIADDQVVAWRAVLERARQPVQPAVDACGLHRLPMGDAL